AIDVAVTILVLAIHWGTFSGVMAATFAGLLCQAAQQMLHHGPMAVADDGQGDGGKRRGGSGHQRALSISGQRYMPPARQL
ncbi:MAG: hypothetical protein RSC66_14370, partial [Comamonas sp.]